MPSARPFRSCITCRRQKQRCDAKKPVCSRCERLEKQCVYETKTYCCLRERRAFGFIKRLMVASENPSDVASIPGMIRDFLSNNMPKNARDDGDRLDTVSEADADMDEPSMSPTVEASDLGESEMGEVLLHTSVDEGGRYSHFGATSQFWEDPPASMLNQVHDSSEAGLEAGSVVSPRSGRDLTVDRADALKMNEATLKTWEELALLKLQFEHGDTTAALIFHLIRTYFCWQNPWHCPVFRPMFIRDMALGGQYYCDFLLYAICAQASRYSVHHNQAQGNNGTPLPTSPTTQDFSQKAKELLFVEMDKPSSVPTIQGLMLLGQRECAMGNTSLAWQYTGMAFTALRDLGIHLDSSKFGALGVGHASAEDRAIRRRVYWSAFTWDKMLSLILGRAPSLLSRHRGSPEHIVDDVEDHLQWQPYFWEGHAPPDIDARACQGWQTSTFKNLVLLCEILESIIVGLYHGKLNHGHNLKVVNDVKSQLIAWFANLPSPIKLAANNLPEHCPPPFIFSLNALYRATWILLYRVFLPNAVVRFHAPGDVAREASRICSRMAEELHQLITLYDRSFRLRNLTSTMSWSMYTAATIDAIDFQSTDPVVAVPARNRLAMALHVLRRGSLLTSSTKRSIEIIRKRLSAPPVTSPSPFSAPPPSQPMQDPFAHLEPTLGPAYDPTLAGTPQMVLPDQIGPVPFSTGSPTEVDSGLLDLYSQLIGGGIGDDGSLDLLQSLLVMPTGPTDY